MEGKEGQTGRLQIKGITKDWVRQKIILRLLPSTTATHVQLQTKLSDHPVNGTGRQGEWDASAHC